jgi:hypothetical protein
MLKVKIHNSETVPDLSSFSAQPAEMQPIEPVIPKVKVVTPEIKPKVSLVVPPPETYFLPMNVKKTLEGNICIYDHPYMDIVISPSNTKIITFPKDNRMKDTYVTQRDFMEFMKDHGLIKFDSIRGGSLHNSLECIYPTPEDVDPISAILIGVYRYVQISSQHEQRLKDYEQSIEQEYLNPDEEHSTDLETANSLHKTKKGSIDPKQMAYGLLYRL